MLPNDPDFACHGHMVAAGNGHILHFVQGAPDDEDFKGLGCRRLCPRFEQSLNPAQSEIALEPATARERSGRTSTTCSCTSAGEIDGKPVPFMNLRMEEPLGPTRTRMWSWFMVDKRASPEFRQRSEETYVRTFGPAGIFDQDDMENWEDCTEAAIGPAAKRYSLHHRMGVYRKPDPNWPGPGIGYADSYGEMTQRAWYGEWLRWMSCRKRWRAAQEWERGMMTRPHRARAREDRVPSCAPGTRSTARSRSSSIARPTCSTPIASSSGWR